ncbi:2Fe-2S iron-sulfur cluster binding domain-containing protein [Nocardia sp. ET3-3]|uniref:2Fe-2S iron-sulfur cluster binding domain-containing protein n=1 Tax=Nocardia terrae TaxID=2675851 RepID=A0A7K1V2C9_9NOCA|nr:PDR/VanB family oxidoreductase [Nocardia terrae]MVU80764.1 2Fe-2S iron-sulfur cluster binding domain-containing protein [Nocardia terrae]
MTDSPFNLVVSGRHVTADDVVSLELRDPSGSPLPVWLPGAHLDLELGDGLIRQYSLCGDPADRDTYRIGVLWEAESRGGSHYVHEKLFPGAAVIARGLRNHFEFLEAERYLFIAGGIGITPLLPMIAVASSRKAQWRLVYCGRSRASMGFRADLDAYPAENVTLYPRDETGRADMADVVAWWEPGTLVYCCGPERFLSAVEKACAAMPLETLRVERFTPREMTAPTLTGSFELVLARTGATVAVPPNRSILEVLLDHGVDVDYACEEGTCGSCETSVLAGKVDHRCSVLSAEERAAQDLMMVCVSRSAEEILTLDI